MDRIEEEYVSFETAKLLRERGFDDVCRAFIAAPTQSVVMRWLREVHNIVIMVEPHEYDYVNEKNKSYICSIFMGDYCYEYIESRDYPSYEEAVEAGINYSLKNLI